ncbi:uncharacterized protein LOC106643607 [Copidosoma floridanum]|uniref:uncharacterized protein LOC106643607 n=1 Tax=Copidosoma floridanum TaxID=29053 RepID=UPI0006C96201|nr:uncharacterized protein LOC106643607 [Copidosoma floridanum]
MLVFLYALYMFGNYVVRRLAGAKDDDDTFQAPYASPKRMREHTNFKRRNSGDSVDEESKSNITFNPPAYVQRFQAVEKILTDPRFGRKLRKVVDFGCSELNFSIYLKKIVGVEEVLFVDIDRDTLDRYSPKAKPLYVDYLHKRSTPLVVRILEGSVNHHDKQLEDVDAVVCIELIEHLYPEDVTNFPYSIFGYIKPKVAIVTTPNADFNVLFNNMSGFRHWDHKFEWTRSQFQDWANNIVSRFQDYEVTFHGICDGPAGTEHLGSCSQMAVFYKSCDLAVPKIPGTEGLFKTVETYEYPYEVDSRSDEEKILADAVYYIRKLSTNNELMEEEVPLRSIMSLMQIPVTESDLRDILRGDGWSIEDREDGPVVMIPPPTQYSDQSTNQENFFDIDAFNDEFDSDGSGVWGRDPGPPADYFLNRVSQYHDYEIDGDPSREDWENEPQIVIVRNLEDEPQNVENDGWGTLPEVGNAELEEENDDSEYANTTSSIYGDDTNLDDLETESHLSEMGNSPRDESVFISSFSETIDSGNSEVSRNLSSQALNLTNTENSIVESGSSIIISESRDNTNFETPENNFWNVTDESSISTVMIETSRANTSVSFENSSDSISVYESPMVYQHTKSLNLDNTTANSHESTFEEPTNSSSLNIPSDCKRRKVDKNTELSNLDVSIHENATSGDVLQSTDSKDNDLSSCSNEVSECLHETKEPKNPANVWQYTSTVPNALKSKILDTKEDAKAENKMEKISPDTPGSLVNSSSPEIMDSGYPNSNTPPDLSPENDFLSVAQLDSESPSIEDAPRIGLFEVEPQNRDLDNNNLDGEGNNLEARDDPDLNALLPIMNELENDLENENDIYDPRNGFPAWLLRIQ